MSTGQIFIELTKPYFYTGETVTGHIYLNLNEMFEGANLQLKLKGWESTMWIQKEQVQSTPENPFQPDSDDLLSASDAEVSQTSTDSSDCKEKPKKGYFKKHGQYYKITHHIGGKEFMKQKIPMQGFGQGMVPQGQYKIPFSFVINEEWPGTFSHKSKDFRGRIKYEMRVKCEFPNDKKDREFKHDLELIIHEKPKKSTAEKLKMSANVKSCCCIPRGESKIKVYFDKNVFFIGDEANIICEIDNSDCSAKVEKIDFSLVQTSVFKDKKNSTHRISTTIASKNFEGVDAGEKAKDEDARKEKLKIDSKIKSKKKVIIPSTGGKFVQSEYLLIVTCSMDTTCACCCGETPIVRLPIQVLPRPFQQQIYQLPMGWQPQIMPMQYVPMPGYQNPPQNINFSMQPYNPQQQPMYPQQQQQQPMYPPQQQQPMYPQQQQQPMYPQQGGMMGEQPMYPQQGGMMGEQQMYPQQGGMMGEPQMQPQQVQYQQE